MNKRYTEHMTLRTCNCDMHGDWRPGATLEAMQETAGAHCAQLGIGRDVTGAMGIAWVLSRARVEFSRVPRIGDAISVETYPLPPKHLFFPRVNTFRDASGAVLGFASSLWLLLDVETRRVVGNPVVLEHLPDNADMPLPIALPATVRPLDAPPRARDLAPVYGDFDVNGHVNNTRYLDWCCNALGPETLAGRRVTAFDVNYETEILPGTALRTEFALLDDRFTFCGFSGDRRCFSVGGTLEAR